MTNEYESLQEEPSTAKLWLSADLNQNLSTQIVYFYGLDYQVPLFQRNPTYKFLMGQLFPDGAVFHRLFNSFFRPKPGIQKEIDKFARERFREYTLGIQLRVGKIPVEKKHFCDLAKALLKQKGADPNTTSIFVASDARDTVWNMITACLPQYNVSWRPDMPGPHTAAGNPGTEEGGLIDMFLLSKCNDIIITHSSSYGTTAAAISDVIPYSTTYAVYCNKNWKVQPIYFYQPLNSEPCFFHCNSYMNKLGEPYVSLLKEDGFWLQYCQCYK